MAMTLRSVDSLTLWQQAYTSKQICHGTLWQLRQTIVIFSTVPVAPQLTLAERTTKLLKIDWLEVAGVDQFLVEYKKQSESAYMNMTTTDFFSRIDNLDSGMMYDIRITSQNSAGSSERKDAYSTGLLLEKFLFECCKYWKEWVNLFLSVWQRWCSWTAWLFFPLNPVMFFLGLFNNIVI